MLVYQKVISKDFFGVYPIFNTPKIHSLHKLNPKYILTKDHQEPVEQQKHAPWAPRFNVQMHAGGRFRRGHVHYFGGDQILHFRLKHNQYQLEVHVERDTTSGFYPVLFHPLKNWYIFLFS